jgi:hypothetical protein
MSTDLYQCENHGLNLCFNGHFFRFLSDFRCTVHWLSIFETFRYEFSIYIVIKIMKLTESLGKSNALQDGNEGGHDDG